MNPPDSQKAMAMSHLHAERKITDLKGRILRFEGPHTSTQIAIEDGCDRGAWTHGISLAKAEKAAGNVRTFVSIVAPSPSIATAPRGKG